MVRNGPAYHPEKAPTEYRYPKPKKNQKLKCTGCRAGLVLGINGKVKTCDGCQGTGLIVAK